MEVNATQKYGKLRLLDMDDMIILKMLGDGCSCKEVALTLGLSLPAISHRLKKFGELWDGFYTYTAGRDKRRIPPDKDFSRIYTMAANVLNTLS